MMSEATTPDSEDHIDDNILGSCTVCSFEIYRANVENTTLMREHKETQDGVSETAKNQVKSQAENHERLCPGSVVLEIGEEVEESGENDE